MRAHTGNQNAGGFSQGLKTTEIKEKIQTLKTPMWLRRVGMRGYARLGRARGTEEHTGRAHEKEGWDPTSWTQLSATRRVGCFVHSNRDGYAMHFGGPCSATSSTVFLTPPPVDTLNLYVVRPSGPLILRIGVGARTCVHVHRMHTSWGGGGGGYLVVRVHHCYLLVSHHSIPCPRMTRVA